MNLEAMSMLDKACLDAEYAVLGALLLDADYCATDIFTKAEPYNFAHEDCRKLFSTARELFAADQPIDAVTVANAAGQAYRDMIKQILDITPTAANYEAYLQILLEKSKCFRTLRGIPYLQDAAESGVLSDVVAYLGRMVDIVTPKSVSEKIHNSQSRYIALMQRLGVKRSFLALGFPKLDSLVHVNPGRYVVIGARPSVGKTAFAINLAMHISKSHNVLFFSGEMPEEDITDRQTAATCSVSFAHLQAGETTEAENEKIVKNKQNMMDNQLTVVDSAGMTTTDIKALTLSTGADVIFVDYISLIRPDNERMTEYQAVSKISSDLQKLARSGVCVFALSQLNRTGDSMAALRSSGQIEQDADCIMMLEVPDKEHVLNMDENGYVFDKQDCANLRVLRVIKQRNGRTGLVNFYFDGKYQQFTELYPEFEKEKMEQPEKIPEQLKIGDK